VDWAARLFVNGDPLLVSTNISETVEVGDNVSFSAFIASSDPLNWEWSFNGSNSVAAGVNSLDSGTNYLNLVEAQASNSGAYTLIVSNNLGSLTSAVMLLNVIPRVEQKPVPAIKLTTQSGSVWSVVYTDSLASAAEWLPLASATVTNGLQYYFDTSPSVPDYRFYKATQSGSVAASATLDMQIATEVTITGNVGDTLLVEAINPIGPTNAWESVGTVTLTNSAQPYFDTTTIGQPQRLYRLMVLP
jgi:hypothetical protein